MILPSRLVGPPAGAIEWPLRVDLMIPRDTDLGRFFVVLGSQSGVELNDNAGLPGDQYGDGIYSATVLTEVAGEVDLRLIRVQDGETTVLWEGPVVPLPSPVPDH